MALLYETTYTVYFSDGEDKSRGYRFTIDHSGDLYVDNLANQQTFEIDEEALDILLEILKRRMPKYTWED